MGNSIASLYLRTIVFAQDIANDTANNVEDGMKNRIFGLDAQTLMDTIIVALSVFVLFVALSYLLFNPARELLKKRQDKIQNDLELANQEKQDAKLLKSDYDAKLKNASKEVDEILSEGRKKALKRENEIIDEAKTEVSRIIDRANKEIELEKSKVKDEMKQEMIAIASVMAGKMIAGNIDEVKQAQLIDEALNEIGDDTWRR